MANEVRAVVLDLDGTLLRSDGTVSLRTVEALRRCEDRLRVVVATARPPRAAFPVVRETLSQFALVCYNGAEAFDAGGRRLYARHIEANALGQLLPWLAHEYAGCPIGVEIEDRLYSSARFSGPAGDGWECTFVDVATFHCRPAAKVLVQFEGHPCAHALASRVPIACRVTTIDRGALAQIMAEGVSKLDAVAHVLARWGMTPGEAVAFGDDLNDADLLAGCGLGIAMGNAVPELKAAASSVTLSNDEDGVAVALDRLLDGLPLQQFVR